MAEISANALMTGSTDFSGPAALKKNLDAILAVYNNVKTSYGPYGLDKMCVDSSGSVVISNDGATILKNMIVDDPAAKLLVNLSLEQDKEVGDGTTSVVLIASNLIEKGFNLISKGIHPSTVVSGYRMAFNESLQYIKEKMAKKISLDSTILGKIVETSMSSKIIYQEKKLFLGITKKALENVFDGKSYQTSKINLISQIGGSMSETEFFDGFIMKSPWASQMMAKTVEAPRALFLDISLLKEKLPLSVNIQVTDPDKLEMIRKEEINMTKNKCKAIIESGCNLLFISGGMDEIAVKMFTENKIVAISRVPKKDLQTLAEASCTTVLKSLVDESNEYKLQELGKCKGFETKAVGEQQYCFIRCERPVSSVLIRGPNSQIVDEVERSLNDTIQILKRTFESKSILPGGGAVETALSFVLEDFSVKSNLKEHTAVYAYSEALLEIPKLLATNAGLNTNSLVAELLKKQYDLFMDQKYNKFLGLDVTKGVVQDNFQAGVVEPTVYKLKALKLATEAAISVLRIHDIIIFPSNKQ